MDGLSVAASIIAVVQITGKIAKLCKGYIEDVKDADSDKTAIYDRILALGKLLKEVEGLIQGPHKDKLESSVELKDALAKCQTTLAELENKLKPRHRDRFKRFLKDLKWPLEKSETEKIVGNIKTLEDTIRFAIQLDGLKVVLNIDRKVDRIAAAIRPITGLPIAEAAIFGSFADQHEPKCLPDTREQLLKDFEAWTATRRDDTKPIFWLSGAAGTGKSTIARTVATILGNKNMLAASFFFKRGGDDRGNASKFVTTIATGLSTHWTDLRTHIEDVVSEDSSISTKAMTVQFENLILGPLALAAGGSGNSSGVSVIVVDALDECDDENNIRLLVTLLGKLAELKTMDIRIFITSRPETPIRAGFRRINGKYTDLVLHDIEEKIIQHDITVFLEKEFEKIAEEHDEILSVTWPGEDIIRQLVELSSPLFIVASTICRLVNDSHFGPKLQLTKIMDYQTKSHISKLSRTYLPIFDQLLVDRDEDEKKLIIENVKDTLGVILVSESPLSRYDISQLLDVDEEVIQYRLNAFHSVFHIPKDSAEPIRPYHLSFREFLMDPKTEAETPFYINEKIMHRILAERCMTLLDKRLKRNTCKLPPLWTRDFEKNTEEELVRKYISPATQYSCRFWIVHVIKSGGLLEDHGKVHCFLQKNLLHWLEFLNLVDLQMIFNLNQWIARLDRAVRVSTAGSPVLSMFLYEIFHFNQEHNRTIAKYPLQIYLQCLLKTPETSMIRRLFLGQVTWLTKARDFTATWGSREPGAELQHLHEDWFVDDPRIKSINFSSNDKQILCGCSDGILRIFDLWGTGVAALEFEIGSEAIAFAILREDRKRKVILVGTDDGGIRILDTKSKVVLHTIKGDNSPRCSNAVSNRALRTCAAGGVPRGPDQDVIYLATASNLSHSITIWKLDQHNTLEMRHTLEVPSAVFINLDARHRSDLLVAASVSSTPDACLQSGAAASQNLIFRVWSLESGELVDFWEPGTGPGVALCSQSCCYESQLNHVDIAVFYNSMFSSIGNTITVAEWEITSQQNKYIRKISAGRTGTNVRFAVRESAREIVSGGADGVIRVWQADSDRIPKAVYQNKGLQSIEAVMVSHDERLVASLSCSGRIDVWELEAPPPFVDTAKQGVDRVLFSPDGKILAVVGYRSIQLWDAALSLGPMSLEIDQFCPHEIENESVRFSADSRWLACVSSNTVLVWSTVSGDLIHDWEEGIVRKRGCKHIDFSPDGQVLALSCFNEVEIWDLSSAQPARSLLLRYKTGPASKRYSNGVSHIALSVDGDHVAWADCCGAVQLCHTRTQKITSIRLQDARELKSGNFYNDFRDTLGLFFLQDDQRLVWAGQIDCEEGRWCIEVLVWDISSERLQKTVKLYTENYRWGLNPQKRIMCEKGVWDLVKWADSEEEQPQFEASLCFDSRTSGEKWWVWKGNRILEARNKDSQEWDAFSDFYDATFVTTTISGDMMMVNVEMDRFEQWHYNEDPVC